MWAWHAPALFDRALDSSGWHIFQHSCFFLSSLLFWWAMLHPRSRSSGYGVSAACLFVTSLVGGALGALMSFSASPWYADYAAMGMTGIGLDPIDDQRIAGLIMWISGRAGSWRRRPGDVLQVVESVRGGGLIAGTRSYRISLSVAPIVSRLVMMTRASAQFAQRGHASFGNVFMESNALSRRELRAHADRVGRPHDACNHRSNRLRSSLSRQKMRR